MIVEFAKMQPQKENLKSSGDFYEFILGHRIYMDERIEPRVPAGEKFFCLASWFRFRLASSRFPSQSVIAPIRRTVST
jgi:hypothetical protein